MGPEGNSKSFEGGDNLGDAVGQAMDETSEQEVLELTQSKCSTRDARTR